VKEEEQVKITFKIEVYFLMLGLLLWTSGCLSPPVEKNEANIHEMNFSEALFRYLIAETRVIQSQKKICLAFGNPLKMPGTRFLKRFDDLNDKRVGLDEIRGSGFEKGFCDRISGAKVVIYQITRTVRLARNSYLIEGAWMDCRENSQKGLFRVDVDISTYHIRKIKIFDRCHHIITSQNQQFFSRRLAF
jgi:hypothetical protein